LKSGHEACIENVVSKPLKLFKSYYGRSTFSFTIAPLFRALLWEQFKSFKNTQNANLTKVRLEQALVLATVVIRSVKSPFDFSLVIFDLDKTLDFVLKNTLITQIER